MRKRIWSYSARTTATALVFSLLLPVAYATASVQDNTLKQLAEDDCKSIVNSCSMGGLAGFAASGSLNNAGSAFSSLGGGIGSSLTNLAKNGVASIKNMGSNIAQMGNLGNLSNIAGLPNISTLANGLNLNSLQNDVPNLNNQVGTLTNALKNANFNSLNPTSSGQYGSLLNGMGSLSSLASGFGNIGNNSQSMNDLSNNTPVTPDNLTTTMNDLTGANNLTSQMNGLQSFNVHDLNNSISAFISSGGPNNPDTASVNAQLGGLNIQVTGITLSSSTAELLASTDKLETLINNHSNTLEAVGNKVGTPGLGSAANTGPCTSLGAASSKMATTNTLMNKLLKSSGGKYVSNQSPAAQTQFNQLLGNAASYSNTASSLTASCNALSGVLGGLAAINPDTIGPNDVAQVKAYADGIMDLAKQEAAQDIGDLSSLDNLNASLKSLIDAGGLDALKDPAMLKQFTNTNQLFSSLTNQMGGIKGLFGSAKGPLATILNGNSGAGNIAGAILGDPHQDDRYKNMNIIGAAKRVDNSKLPDMSADATIDPGLQGVMPATIMPNKNTPALSLVSYFPWLWKDADPEIQDALYTKKSIAVYSNVASSVRTDAAKQSFEEWTDPTGNSANDVNLKALQKFQCKPIAESCVAANNLVPGEGDTGTYERWNRLQYDSCANQYIIPLGSLSPDLIFSNDKRSHAEAYNESWCQPLALSNVPCVPDLFKGGACKLDKGSVDGFLYDYRLWGYLERAWKDVLGSNYLPNVGNTDSSSYPIKGKTPVTIITDTSSHIEGPNILGEQSLGKPVNTPFEYSTPGFGTGYGEQLQAAYPYGTGIQYPTNQPAYMGRLTSLGLLVAQNQNVERILDPTHPYSPRWDFKGTDRDYSNSAKLKLAIPPIYDGYDVNGVYNKLPNPYNASGANDLGYDQSTLPPPLGVASTGECIVRCAAVPVDILSFRAPQFNSCMTCRIRNNEDCFWSQVAWYQIPWSYCDVSFWGHCWSHYRFYGEDPVTAQINTIRDQRPSNDSYTLPNGTRHGPDCHSDWGVGVQEFNLLGGLMGLPDCMHWIHFWAGDAANSKGISIPPANFPYGTLSCKTDHNEQGKWPLCSTKFDHPADPEPNAIVIGNALVPWFQTHTISCAYCTAASGDPNEANGVKKCCNDLAQALVPINTLKIRNTYYQKGDLQLENTPEGYSFKEYFGNHMPYMRWWDTGNAAGGTMDTTTNYNPYCDRGQYDTIVGVGTEGKGGKYCRYGGNGVVLDANGKQMVDSNNKPLTPSYKCISLASPDALTSWTELKTYQTRFIRDHGLNCLGQYEKFDKQFGAEDGALNAVGGRFFTPQPNLSDPTGKTYQQKRVPWPKTWCGYGSDSINPAALTEFPNFGADAKNKPSTYLLMGLDNAQKGDIIYLTHLDVAPNVQGVDIMPFIAVVTSANHLGKCNDSVTIQEMNNGKYPDVCGVTSSSGLGQTRIIYKEWLPTPVYEALYSKNGTSLSDSCGDHYDIQNGYSPILSYGTYCGDPKLSQCTFLRPGKPNYWNKIRIYRPSMDERGSPP